MPFVNVKKPANYDDYAEAIVSFEMRMREAEKASVKGIMKSSLMKEVSQINFERTRYFYGLFLQKQIDKKFLEYLSNQGIIDGSLLKYWMKPGFSNLCCLLCLSTPQTESTCICRVPKKNQTDDFQECVSCGCKGCYSSKTHS
jgi:G10 protein